MELGILHNSPPSTKRGCRAGRLHRLWHGLPPAPWPCTRSQHHSVPSRNLHPLMVPPFLQPHPDLQSAVGNAPLSSKHPAQLPTTDCLLSIISPMGGQPSDAPALSPPSPLQQGGQSSNAPALSPPSPLPQGGQPIALALSPPSPPPQGGQPSDAPGLSPSSSTLLLCPSDSTLNICHLNSQSAVKTGKENEHVGSRHSRFLSGNKKKKVLLSMMTMCFLLVLLTISLPLMTLQVSSLPNGGTRASTRVTSGWKDQQRLTVLKALRSLQGKPTPCLTCSDDASVSRASDGHPKTYSQATKLKNLGLRRTKVGGKFRKRDDLGHVGGVNMDWDSFEIYHTTDDR
ncbi:hypothetical protein ACOMHN_062447 [Nucella lapillus]